MRKTCVCTDLDFSAQTGKWVFFYLSTLKVVSESHVKWATSVPILVFLGLSVLELCPMYVTDRHTSDRQMSDKSIA